MEINDVKMGVSLIKRDGAARTAEIMLENTYATPFVIDFTEEGLTEKNEFTKLDFGVVPDAASDIVPELYGALKARNEGIEVLTGLKAMSARKVVELITSIRRESAVKPIYAVAAATPANLPILAYLGVDVFDNILAISKAYEGFYFTSWGELEVSSISNLPCQCEACREGLDVDNVAGLVRHNTIMLQNEAALVRELIKREELRNYVEMKCKASPELTVMLRLADEFVRAQINARETEARFQRFKRSTAYFNTIESFSRPEVTYFFQRSAEVYSPRSKTVLLLPCSAKKPYLTSKTHRTVRNAVGRLIRGVNEIIISSPLVVPRELELVYPAINYDTPVTGYWSDEEINFVAERLASLLTKGEFETVIAHVEGGYRKAVEKALSIAGMDCVFTAEGNILSAESLSRLRQELEKADRVAFDLYEEIFRHVCMYQYGVEVEGRLRGRYPELELFEGQGKVKRVARIARIDTRYGCLEPNFILAEKLLKLGRYAVRIDDFDPKGTIFAPAVLEADSSIKPGDYVVFHNSTILGVGRALMFGDEMVEAIRGYAIEVRRKRRTKDQ